MNGHPFCYSIHFRFPDLVFSLHKIVFVDIFVVVVAKSFVSDQIHFFCSRSFEIIFECSMKCKSIEHILDILNILVRVMRTDFRFYIKKKSVYQLFLVRLVLFQLRAAIFFPVAHYSSSSPICYFFLSLARRIKSAKEQCYCISLIEMRL